MTECKNQTRLHVISSSIPADINDWRSVFIMDQVIALSRRFDVMFYGPPTEVDLGARQVIDSKSMRQLLSDTQKLGGFAQLLRGKHYLKLIYRSLRWFSHVRSIIQQNQHEQDVYLVNWIQNIFCIPARNKRLIVNVLGTDLKLLQNPLINWLVGRYCNKHQVLFLCNAEWMVPELKRLLPKGKDVRFNPLGIREEWFEVTEPQSRELIISVSRVTRGKVSLLLDWIKASKAVEKLHLIGPRQEVFDLPDWAITEGPSTMDELRNYWYPRAKMLIFLSQHPEGRPQTIVEAMSSGVPVICLDNPIFRELIIHERTGYLVNSAQSLRDAVESLTKDDRNHEISDAARKHMKHKIGDWNDYAYRLGRYIDELSASGNQLNEH